MPSRPRGARQEGIDLLTDATGNVLGLVDEAGKCTHTYAYTAYGTDYSDPVESFSQPYRYAGAYLDPTGLYKMGARYYDPTLGRFTQPDPSGQENNPYLYAAGDPINRIDPSGLGWLQGVGDAISNSESIVGVVTGCIAGLGAASETGIIQAAGVFGGGIGAVGAAVGSCALGGAMGYAGMDIISYG